MNDQIRVIIGLDQNEIDDLIIDPLDVLSQFALHLLENKPKASYDALTRLGIEEEDFRKAIVNGGRLAKINRKFRDKKFIGGKEFGSTFERT